MALNPDDSATFHPANGKSKKGFQKDKSPKIDDLIGKYILSVRSDRTFLETEIKRLNWLAAG